MTSKSNGFDRFLAFSARSNIMTSKFTIDPEALSLEEKADTALESFADLLVEMAGEELLKAIDRRSIQEEEREAEFDRLLERFKDKYLRKRN